MDTNTNLHAVFATDGNGKTYRVSDPLSWERAQAEWNKLDELHRAGRLPQAKFYEVRSVTLGPDRPLVGPEVHSHDRYDKAPLDMNMVARVPEGSRGFKNEQDAARVAWRTFAPTFRSRWDKTGSDKTARTGTQGLGGWFFWPNGTTAAQGLRDLVRVCKARKMIVQGVNGKWFPVEQEVL